MLGADAGESRAQIQRYIRLTHLIPELLQWMDEGKMTLSSWCEVSFLAFLASCLALAIRLTVFIPSPEIPR